MIECDLQSYLVGILHVEVDVERVKVIEFLSSVHVYSQCSQPNVFMAADLWSEGAYVRWWGKTCQAIPNWQWHYTKTKQFIRIVSYNCRGLCNIKYLCLQ